MTTVHGGWLLSDEYSQLEKVAWDASNDVARKGYAQWLTGKDDRRAKFLHSVAVASESMKASDLPPVPDGVAKEWVELVGYRLLDPILANGFSQLKMPLLRLARPALRMIKSEAVDSEISVGASKVGGNPDLPEGVAWPLGKECRATYNDDTSTVEKPAGFLFQINLEEIAKTQAARDLPSFGLLSFFSYVNWKNPDVIGAKVSYFPDVKSLSRRATPDGITQGNRPIQSQRLSFEEMLDIPDPGGPWGEEIGVDSDQGEDYVEKIFDPHAELNRYGFLGYAKTYQENDATPSKDSRHLVMAENVEGMTLHIQIPAVDLARRNFDAITLNWVDFD